MRPRRLRAADAGAAVVVAAALVATVSCSSGGGGRASNPAPTEPPSTAAVTAQKVTLEALLTGRAVVPGPGALSGRGAASITLDRAKSQVCFQLSVDAIDPAQDAQIYTGPAGAIGPALVALTPPAGGKSDGCVPADPGILDSIAINPGGFYVAIRNVQFPGGALRGQLALG